MSRKVIDPNGPEWLNVKRRVTEELNAAREEMEAACLPPAETEHLRGKIAAFRWLLALEEAETQIPSAAPNYSLLR
jgi:hypothetical protein